MAFIPRHRIGRHGHSGHLFQGRYKAILVDKDRYLLELSRYVVLNPLRAKGMVNRLEDWPWSNYLAMVEDAPRPEWLTTTGCYLRLASEEPWQGSDTGNLSWKACGINLKYSRI